MTTTRERMRQMIEMHGGSSLLVVDTSDLRELLSEIDAKCRWWQGELSAVAECGFAWADQMPAGVFRFCPGCGKEIVSE